ncbi:MAG: precorrin-6Y C5,15-methyltransferase (decarboxylating) subunit CbiT [bacterium]|nr:precorrin-6Y C5,15-methyltransferase (decarboxylating) subunit CbiT [bacterium]
MSDFLRYSIPNDQFITGAVPITKEEIRTIVISKLRLKPDSTVIDIGAGTGSVSIEIACSVKNGFVYSIEKNDAALKLINQNVKKFEITNIKIIRGAAPEALANLRPVDRAFVGGSGGSITEILTWLDENISEDGRIVITAITLETLTCSKEFFSDREYTLEIIQAAVTKYEERGRFFMANAGNPVFILSAQKEKAT